MAKVLKGPGKRVEITATAARSSGDFVLEDGFHGVCVNDIADTEVGIIDIEQVEVEIDEVGTPAKGDIIYHDGTNLTATATGNRPVMAVTLTDSDSRVPTGKMRALVLPQGLPDGV